MRRTLAAACLMVQLIHGPGVIAASAQGAPAPAAAPAPGVPGSTAAPAPASVAQLAAGLRSTDRNVRYRASMALARAGRAAVPALIEAMRDPGFECRVAAANALRDLGPQAADAVGVLAESLSCSIDRELGYPPKDASLYAGSPALQVRWSAVTALGHMGQAALPAVPALLAALSGETEAGLARPATTDVYGQRHWRGYEMRGAAAWVLQRLGPAALRAAPGVIPRLADALGDPERMVRLNAAAALAAMGAAAADAVPALTQALRHPDPHTRVAAARALGAIGTRARPAVPAMLACLEGIRGDTYARAAVRDAVRAITGVAPPVPASRVPAPPAWPGLSRRDFLLVVQPYQDSSVAIEPSHLVDAFVQARMGNAITYWADHTWYNTPPPSADYLRSRGMAVVWYFFTEDIFNPKLQRDWGFASVDAYNADMARRILASGRMLGKASAYWAVGHEQMDALPGWEVEASGEHRAPAFRTRQDGYEFYRRWITTSLHQRHWMEYGNTRASKFFDGWNTGAPATWEFIGRRRLDTAPVTMVSGGVSPVLAHAAFDILPRIGAYWWECQTDGASLQIGAAYTRGAARQYGRAWLMDASPWSSVHGSPGWGYVDGKWTGGATDETQLRTWLYGYLAGARAVIEESSGGTHFRIDPYPHGPWDRPIITSTGRTAQAAARFCFQQCADRGDPYTPVAVLLEQAHGFEPRPHTNFRGKGAWGYLPVTDAERSIDAFWKLAFPGHSRIPDRKSAEAMADPRAAEPAMLVGSPFGDCFDVLTDRAPAAAFARYRRIVMLGGIQMRPALWRRLRPWVAGGGELLLSVAHLGPDMAHDLASASATGPGVTCRIGRGRVTVATAPHYLEAGEPQPRWSGVVAAFLQRWMRAVWPCEVETASGAAPQVMLNRLRDGWLVVLGNHGSAPWSGRVTLTAGGRRVTGVRELWSGQAAVVQPAASGVRFEAAAPPFALRVYRVRTAASPVQGRAGIGSSVRAE